jgi:hypothetical protein
MKKGTIIALLSVLAAGIGVGLFFAFKKPKSEEDAPDAGSEDGTPEISGEGYSGTGSTGSSSMATPFTNKADGDKFRGWVNDKYPDYARSIDLDRSGSYNNDYIRKAWSKYGQEYQAEAASWITSFNSVKAAVATLPSGVSKEITDTYVKIKKDNYSLYLFNNGRAILKTAISDVWRGVYYNGGSKLTITSGLNKGKTYNGTLYENLVNSLKQNFSNFADDFEESEAEGAAKFGQFGQDSF